MKLNKIITLAAILTVSSIAQATITTGVPFGGNDNGNIQMFSGLTNTVVGGAPLLTSAPLDVSQFDSVTLFLNTTNWGVASTNILKLYRNIDGTLTTTETTAYATYNVVLAAGSITMWQTNLYGNDIVGQGYLVLSLTNNATGATTTNGSGGAGFTFTNAIPSQIGIATKIKHALR